MKAMILAAGRGKRMMPLTKHTPKPMLKVSGKPLLEFHVERLAAAGFDDLVINHCYLGKQIEAYFGNGEKFGINIHWSRETEALETAGGIKQALPLLGNEPFVVVNGDIWTDFPFEKLTKGPIISGLQSEQVLAHLILVNNPKQNPQGDFGLIDGLVTNQSSDKKTFSGIAVYSPEIVKNCQQQQIIGLAPLLRNAADTQRVSGEIYVGDWFDIGTPERLAELEKKLTSK